MKAAACLLVVVLLASMPATASPEVHAKGVTAAALDLQAEGILGALRPAAGSTWHVEGSVDGVVVDERFTRAEVPLPTMPPYRQSLYNRTVEAVPPRELANLQWSDVHSDAAIIVDGRTTGAKVAGSIASAELRPQAPTVIEDSHAWERSSGHPDYYAYAVDEVVNATGTTAALRVEGEFTIYIWSAAATLSDARGTTTLSTGYSETPLSPGLAEAHYVFALLEVRGALVLRDADAALYSTTMSATPAGWLSLQGGTGDLAKGIHNHEVRGDASLNGGRYAVVSSGRHLAVDVIGHPIDIEGDIRTTTHFARLPGFGAWATLAGLAAVLLAAFAVVRARVLGAGEDWLMAASEAQAKGRRAGARLAIAAARLARAQPADVAMARGHLLLDVRPAPAAVAFERAYRRYEEAGVASECAFSALHVARAYARLLDGSRAAAWLRLAVRSDAEILQRAAAEPDFEVLAGDATFREAMGRLMGSADVAA